MAATVPAQYQQWVSSAAAGTGLPQSVVAAQINEESGFNPTVTSPAGAQGIAQIEPGTWAGLGIPGSPYNPQDALQGYTKLMSQLLARYGGNVRDALAAYNAGSGNLAAGYGYADAILSAAGQPSGAQAQTPTDTSPSGSAPASAPQSTQNGGGILSGLGQTIDGIPVYGAFVVLGGVLLLVVALNVGGIGLL